MDIDKSFRSFTHGHASITVTLEIDHRRFNDRVAKRINESNDGAEKRLRKFGSHKEAALWMVAMLVVKQRVEKGTVNISQVDSLASCGNCGLSVAFIDSAGVTDLF